MKIDNDKIFELLDTILDPITGIGLVKAKKVYNVELNDDKINFDLVTNDVEPIVKGDLNLAIIDLFANSLPQYKVNVNMVSWENITPQKSGNNDASMTSMVKPLTDLGSNPLPQVKNIIAIASGKGGVGKSSVAVNLAISLKDKGFRVGLIDGDMYGPSIPTMLNLNGKRPGLTKLYGADKLLPIEAFGIYTMSIGFFLEPDQAVILRGPKLDGVMRQFVKDVVWPELDYMVIDLPPGTGDVQLSLVQLLSVTGAIMVTTPQQVALDDAVKAMNMFLLSNVEVPILGVIENMSWFETEELPGRKFYIFGQGGGKKLAEKGETELLAQIPIFESIREGGDDGVPVVLTDERVKTYYSELASSVDRRTNIRNEVLDPTKIVDRS